jgi:hypothetical protein
LATLSPRDRQWVLSYHEQLAQAYEAGDMARIRRIFSHQVTEAEDPAAVKRLLQLMSRRTADPRHGQSGSAGGE